MNLLWGLPRAAVVGSARGAARGFAERGMARRRLPKEARGVDAGSVWQRGAKRGLAAAAEDSGGRASESGLRVDGEAEVSKEEDGGEEEMPFPRIGWTPGSFGARALRPSRKRRPGEPTGRTKPPRTENDYWHEAGVYNDPKQ